MAGARGATIKALHEKHGPVVQLAPNELSFSGVEAMKRIYNVGTTCRKADIYVSFGRRGIFQMLDPDEHKQRLKRVSPWLETWRANYAVMVADTSARLPIASPIPR